MLRKYKSEDAEALTKLWLRCSVDSHNFVNDNHWKNLAEDIRNVYLPSSKTYVWDNNGKQLGFVSLQKGGHIGALFVDKKHQGQGIGSMLLNSLRRKHKTLDLKVYRKNTEAMRFYMQHGFKVCGTQTDETTGEEEFLMKWSAE